MTWPSLFLSTKYNLSLFAFLSRAPALPSKKPLHHRAHKRRRRDEAVRAAGATNCAAMELLPLPSPGSRCTPRRRRVPRSARNGSPAAVSSSRSAATATTQSSRSAGTTATTQSSQSTLGTAATQRTRVAQFAVADARNRNAHQARSERHERSQQREQDEARYLQRADAGRSHALQSNERAKEHRRLKHEYNQTVASAIRTTEAEWDAERQSGVDRPRPAAFGSYSAWAGPKEVADGNGTLQTVGCSQDGAAGTSCGRAIRSAGRMQFRPTTTPGVTSHVSISDQHAQRGDPGGDPGAYDPFAHSNLAAVATATFNTKCQEQVAARAAQALQTGGDGSGSSGGTSGYGISTKSTALAVPAEPAPWWLFKFNSIPLREEASSGELKLQAAAHNGDGASTSPLGQLLLLRHQNGPNAQACAHADASDGAGDSLADGADDVADGMGDDAGNSVGGIPPGSIPTVGSYLGHKPLNARARKELRERTEAAEREARWKAKHHRGAHVPPPLPSRMRKKRAPGTRDYYAILKVPPSCSTDQIKHAYHKLAREWHPDRVHAAGTNNADPDKARRMFVLIARAYEVLGDSTIRSAYDAGEDVDAKAKFSGTK